MSTPRVASKREARAVAKLDHPNIVQVHRVGQHDDMFYIVMQHIDGQTLHEYMEDQPTRDVSESLGIIRQIAEALQVAHDHGLTHRDIKPSNIMIDENGRVKVMDFGLARHGDSESQLTQTGMYIGTPMYSSPEQCETKSVDQRSDLYSLGVILYELLSGQRPHKADTPLALMRKIVYEAPADIRSINKDLPSSVTALVDRLLAKKPSDRTDSAATLIAAIDAISDGRPVPVAARPPSRRPLLIAAAACLIAIIAIAALSRNWNGTGRTRSEPGHHHAKRATNRQAHYLCHVRLPESDQGTPTCNGWRSASPTWSPPISRSTRN